MNTDSTLNMSPFEPADPTLPILNLDSAVSDYYNIFSKKFFSCVQKLSPQDVIGVRKSEIEIGLKNAIRKFLQIEENVENNTIIFGFGSYSILERLAWKILPKGFMIGDFPTFAYFPLEYMLAGGEYKGILKSDFSFPMEEILQEIATNKNVKIIYITNPNNPTGQTIPQEFLLEIIQAAQKKSVTVMVDEVYGDLLPVSLSASKWIRQFENLIVMRSFSKIFGLQNIRVGYMIANDKFIEKYQRLCNGNEITNVGALIATEVLQNTEYQKQLKQNCQNNKKILIDILESSGYTILPTNDLVPLLCLKAKEGVDIQEFFRMKNIKIGNNAPLYMLQPDFPKEYGRIRVPIDTKDIEILKSRLCA